MTSSEMDYKATVKKEKNKWRVYVPDPGWVDCGDDCKLCKPRDKERQLIATHQLHDTRASAIRYASYLGFKEIDVSTN